MSKTLKERRRHNNKRAGAIAKEMRARSLDEACHILVGIVGKAEARKRQVRDLHHEVARLTGAIRWALGEEGEFGDEPPPLAGRYRMRFWWRSELRRRAFGEPATVSAGAASVEQGAPESAHNLSSSVTLREGGGA